MKQYTDDQMSDLSRQVYILMLLLCLAVTSGADAGTLSENQRILSQQLGYELQYRVYRPESATADAKLPTLYVTDGQDYLEYGNFKTVLDNALTNGDIEPVIVVFLDSRNPDNLEENRRNSQFLCNTDFAYFFANELIPAINRDYPVSVSRDGRVILGLSFGGLNSACFGLTLSEVFSGIAMQSPANADHVKVVRKLYEEREKLPLKVYLSAGTVNDNYDEVKRFRRTLEKKGYDLTHTWVRKGQHNWANWGPLLDDILITFFAKQVKTRK